MINDTKRTVNRDGLACHRLQSLAHGTYSPVCSRLDVPYENICVFISRVSHSAHNLTFSLKKMVGPWTV